MNGLYFTLLLSGLAIAAYVGFIRPTLRNLPHFKEFYDQADSRWQRLVLGLRQSWDLVVAQLLIVGPELPGLIQSLINQDISALVPGDTAKVVNQLLGLLYIGARAFVLVSTRPKQ